MPPGTGARVSCFGTPEGWKVEEIARGHKKTTADPGTRPHQLTILYALLTELCSTALLRAACPKECLGLAHTSPVPPLSTGNMTSAPSTEIQQLFHQPQVCSLCWYEKEEALEVQASSPPPLNCPVWSGLLLGREQELTDTVLFTGPANGEGLSAPPLSPWVDLQDSLFSVGFPSLPKEAQGQTKALCSWAICTGYAFLSTYSFYPARAQWIESFWIRLNCLNGALKKESTVQRGLSCWAESTSGSMWAPADRASDAASLKVGARACLQTRLGRLAPGWPRGSHLQEEGKIPKHV